MERVTANEFQISTCDFCEREFKDNETAFSGVDVPDFGLILICEECIEEGFNKIQKPIDKLKKFVDNK